MNSYIKQNGKIIIESNDDISVPMIYNNIAGKNMHGIEHEIYLKSIAMGQMGFKPGRIELFRNGIFSESCVLPNV